MKDLTVYKNYFLAVTVTGNFIAVLESSTVNVALYEIAKSFSISLNEVQLVTSVYILVFTAFLPLFGKLSDMVDRNKLYAFGFLLFGLGAVFNTISTNFPMLLVSRSVEAVGGAVLISNSAALITLMFKGEKRGSALGVIGASVALGGISGPAVAGALIQYFGWHTVFIPSAIVGLIGTLTSLKYIPSFKVQQRKYKDTMLDIVGFLYFVVALFSIFSVLACYKNVAFVKNNTFLLCLISTIFWILFYKRETTCENPLINLSLFKNKTFSLGCFALLLWFITAYAHCLLFPFTLQEALGYKPLVTGLLMLPFSVMVMIIAPFSGKYAGKHLNSRITVVGATIYFIGFSLLLLLKPNLSILVLILSSLIMGIGNGMFQSPSNTSLMSTVPKDEVGTASGLLSLARNSGMIFGIAFALGIFDFVKNYLLNVNTEYNLSCIFAFKSTVLACLLTILITGISLYFAYVAQKQS